MKAEFDEYLATLGRTERLSPRELAGYQQQLLARLVCHAHDNLPFYRARLACLFTTDERIDLSRWNEVPFLTRDHVIHHGEELRVATLPQEYGEVAEASTSGSTGVPLRVATNGQVFFAGNASLTRMARWFGLDTSRGVASIRRFIDEPAPQYPEGRASNGWSYTDPGAAIHELDMMTPVPQQLEWLGRVRAPYLFTQPSLALAIAYAVTPDEGRDLGIEAVLLFAETVPDGTREIVAERLGARTGAVYSCREVGIIACECASMPHYHVAAENALVEIVDDWGRDVAFGERGRVVVTGLSNYAMPFIRYQLGDVAIAGPASCPCGRTLPVIARIEGRTRNAFIFRDGSRVWPRAMMVRPMRAFVPFVRFQLVQLDHEKIELRYVADGSGRLPDLAALNAYARTTLHPSIEVIATELDSLPLGPHGKFEEFVSHVDTTSPAATLPG